MFRRGDKFSDQLSAYIDGLLSQREGRALEAHLQACPSCQRQLQELVAPRPWGRRPAPFLGGLAIPARLAAASLAFALAAVVVLDLGDFGGGGKVPAPLGTPAPAAERAAAPSPAQGEGQADLQGPEATSTPAAAAPQKGQPAATRPSPYQVEGGGLDPLRAAEIGLSAALGTVALAYGALVIRNRRAIRAVIPPEGR